MCMSIKVNHPELVLGEGEHHGYEWLVVNNGRGYRCGYVRVPKGHPWYGVDYDNVRTAGDGWPSVHGGLTFAEHDVPCDKGGPDDGYWLGFDCAHCFDAPDPALPSDHNFTNYAHGEVRTQEYVEAECRSLCEQAEAAAAAKSPVSE